MKQLAIPFAVDDYWQFDSFVEPDNCWVVPALRQWSDESCVDSFCWLWGGFGAGKSHLLHALGCSVLDFGRVFYLDLFNYKNYEIEIFDDLDGCYLICLDNIDAVIGDFLWEKALFNLYNNIVMLDNAKLIVSAKMPVDRFNFRLDDLASRMSQGLQLEVKSLKDDLLKQALIMRAQGLSFDLAKEVANYMVTHFKSCSHCLFNHIDYLSMYSLQFKRRVTVPLVKELQEQMQVCKVCCEQ